MPVTPPVPVIPPVPSVPPPALAPAPPPIPELPPDPTTDVPLAPPPSRVSESYPMRPHPVLTSTAAVSARRSTDGLSRRRTAFHTSGDRAPTLSGDGTAQQGRYLVAPAA